MSVSKSSIRNLSYDSEYQGFQQGGILESSLEKKSNFKINKSRNI